jgi:hypothetical protein
MATVEKGIGRKEHEMTAIKDIGNVISPYVGRIKEPAGENLVDA